MLLVIFFIKTLKFTKFVADISIAQEVQDSNNLMQLRKAAAFN